MGAVAHPANPHEEAYNASHIKTRNTIERAFGVLKRRFAYLGMKVRVKLSTVKAVIVSAMILHNIAVKTRLLLQEEDLALPVEEMYRGNVVDDNAQGNRKRQRIIQEYF